MPELLLAGAGILWTCMLSLSVKLMFDTRKDVRKINGSIAGLLQWKEDQEKRCGKSDQERRDLWGAVDKLRERA